MHARGLARGRIKNTHVLTETRQGKFQYTIGPYSDPVLLIEPGDRVVVETVDTFEGKIRTDRDLPTQKLRAPFLNPQCGPIMVEGATKGDVLAVYIESIVPRGQNPRGTVRMIPHLGGLTSTDYTATLNEPLPERVKKVDVDESSIYWTDSITLPYRPHRGYSLFTRDRRDKYPESG